MKFTMKVRIVSVALMLAIAGTGIYFVHSATAADPAPAEDFREIYGVSQAAADAMYRTEWLAEHHLWADAGGPWVTAYRQFPPFSHDRTTVMCHGADQAVTFWEHPAGPTPAQKAVLESVALEMLTDPTPDDDQIWSGITLAGMLGIAHRPDIAALIAAQAQDDETRAWAASGGGRWGR